MWFCFASRSVMHVMASIDFFVPSSNNLFKLRIQVSVIRSSPRNPSSPFRAVGLCTQRSANPVSYKHPARCSNPSRQMPFRLGILPIDFRIKMSASHGCILSMLEVSSRSTSKGFIRETLSDIDVFGSHSTTNANIAV